MYIPGVMVDTRGRIATWMENRLPHLPHHRAQYPNTVGFQGLSPSG